MNDQNDQNPHEQEEQDISSAPIHETPQKEAAETCSDREKPSIPKWISWFFATVRALADEITCSVPRITLALVALAGVWEIFRQLFF
ncbi:MAG: hypothetical protein AAF558_13865 [Verrucomicrobiota bacterium]